ncbi:hypothetical protein M422DRAFT_266331 [Sphaerobolus stellatus SS14]|uniref:Uncharacterized protein n=1 Tax=Sphaerobolus stellatus (strain SS14) TaxID=990650 RepID=A0A0C9V369_SPHS4|nr:hypothetical protein M422DRAFT_266331 [Sphaerobolus stellatus SS14]
MEFYITHIRTRWLADQRVDFAAIPPVTLTHVVPQHSLTLRAVPLPAPLMSNPLDSRLIFQEAQSALRPHLEGIQTSEQLLALLRDIREMRNESNAEPSANTQRLQDPPVISKKGRPRTSRLTAAREGVRKSIRRPIGLRRTLVQQSPSNTKQPPRPPTPPPPPPSESNLHPNPIT